MRGRNRRLGNPDSDFDAPQKNRPCTEQGPGEFGRRRRQGVFWQLFGEGGGFPHPSPVPGRVGEASGRAQGAMLGNRREGIRFLHALKTSAKYPFLPEAPVQTDRVRLNKMTNKSAPANAPQTAQRGCREGMKGRPRAHAPRIPRTRCHKNRDGPAHHRDPHLIGFPVLRELSSLGSACLAGNGGAAGKKLRFVFPPVRQRMAGRAAQNAQDQFCPAPPAFHHRTHNAPVRASGGLSRQALDMRLMLFQHRQGGRGEIFQGPGVPVF
jgi:hypothetical protein